MSKSPARLESRAPSNLRDCPNDDFDIAKPKPVPMESLNVIMETLRDKGATSRENARRLELLSTTIQRLMGRDPEFVTKMIEDCHRYTERHLNGNRIRKGLDDNGAMWMWLESDK